MTTTYTDRGAITIAPEGVASSSGFTAGVESAVYDNTSNGDDDVLIGGVWTSGTTPTINTQVNIYAFAPRDLTPTYPDVMDGTSSAETLTSAGVGAGFLKPAAALTVDATTSNRAYECGLFSVRALFGGVMPPRFSLFISHNTVAAANATAGNHVWKATGVKFS